MEKSNKMQIAIMAVFGVAIAAAVLIFSGIIPIGKNAPKVPVAKISLWAPFPSDALSRIFTSFNASFKDTVQINYSAKDYRTYESEVINALASGTGPDIFVLTQETALRNKDKIFIVPLTWYPERTYLDSFVGSAEIFLDRIAGGIIGFPFAIDPMVLYWNKDLFSSEGISAPPQYWDEFLTDVQLLSKKDKAGNILQSGVALGESKNVKNSKGILSSLLLQSGNKIIDRENKKMDFNIGGSAENALKFYEEFSNPNKLAYSWNRGLPLSDEAFSNGILAMYFGYAGEIERIKQKNPHLNFDIAPIPQIRDSRIKTSHANVYAMVISKNSKYKEASSLAITSLIFGDYESDIAQSLGIAPSRRDLLAAPQKNPLSTIVYKTAVAAKTWLEPDPQKTSSIFQNMIESTLVGQTRISDAVADAENKMGALIR